MESKHLHELILANIDEVIAQTAPQGVSLWQSFLEMHPADSAKLLTHLSDDRLIKLFLKLSQPKQLELFEELPDHDKETILEHLDDVQKAFILRQIPIDDLTDLFDQLSDKELKKYLDILHKKDKQRVLSLMKFPADSAGGIMTLDFVTLIKDLTVENAVSILQRVKPNIDLHRQIYVTDQHNKLVGYINLEDLLLKSPSARLESFLKQVPYTAQVQEDQEKVAQKMVHYHMMTVPVVNEQQFLLGVIPEDTLIDVIQQEATEDVQRISAAPLATSYFDMSFWQLLYKRGFILAILLMMGSLTSFIIGHFESTLTSFLVLFFTMLVSTGGNTGGQTSAIAIQAMSSGDLNETNTWKFIIREFLIGTMLAFVLACISFARVYVWYGDFTGSLVVSLSLGIIVLMSVLLGACFPILLKKIGVDPAFSASPLLATVMDILGIFIYCYVAYLILT